MLKTPRPGYVKTRLARDVGPTKAARIYRRLVEHQINNLPLGWPIQVHYAPSRARKEMLAWLGDRSACVPQTGGGLGRRLVHAMNHAFQGGAAAVIFLGGDCPYVTTAVLTEAARLLRRQDLVVGPACDGGYYLIGLRTPRPGIFEGIDWGTDRVFNQTRAQIRVLNLRGKILNPLEDVDDAGSWNRARRAWRNLRQDS
ncbi:MAG: TIGR04282 family arsenosugar biosynthesis glycosyltransferase [Verrucomicrobia bacterium]|nr:TIGR04282 family arsenosugar biosynthesis glycosyltransferase [Verrucomicrobiota bacterium]